MNQLEDRASLADRLMMGPDGVVYALGVATIQVRSHEGGEGGGGLAFLVDAPRRDPGVIDPCFAYGAVRHRDGGNPPICFKYSAEVPHRDPGDPPICFAY